MHYAVENKHVEIVKLLINAGANKDITNSHGATPREVAMTVGHIELEELFPQEIMDDILPLEAEQYRTYKDLAPQVFPDHEQ